MPAIVSWMKKKAKTREIAAPPRDTPIRLHDDLWLLMRLVDLGNNAVFVRYRWLWLRLPLLLILSALLLTGGGASELDDPSLPGLVGLFALYVGMLMLLRTRWPRLSLCRIELAGDLGFAIAFLWGAWKTPFPAALMFLVPAFFAADNFGFPGVLLVNLFVAMVFYAATAGVHLAPPIGMATRTSLLFAAGAAFAFYQGRQRAIEAILRSLRVGISVIGQGHDRTNYTDMRVLWLNPTQRRSFPNVKAGTVCFQAYNSAVQNSPCPWCPVIPSIRDGKTHVDITHSPDAADPFHIRHWRVTSSPLLGPGDSVIGAVEVVQEITDEQELKRLLERVPDIHDDVRIGDAAEKALAVARANRCYILTLDDSSPKGSLVAAWSGPADKRLGLPPKNNNLSCPWETLRTDQSFILQIPEGRSGVRSELEEFLRRQRIRNVFVRPVSLHGHTWSAVILGWFRPSAVRDEARPFLVNSVSPLVVALNQARLAEAAGVAYSELEGYVRTLRHELLSPLEAMRGVVHHVQAEALPPHLAEWLDYLDIDATRACRLIRRTAAALDIKKGHLILMRDSVRLTSVLDAVHRTLEWLAEENGVTLEFEFSAPPELEIRADGDMFFEVLANLVENAIRYTPSPGQVSVTTSQTDEIVSISIKDTGTGIPDDEKTRIFAEHYRMPNADAVGGPGLGLGLFIVKGIVEAHGWQLTLESKLGAGSVFCLRIPLEGR